MSTNRELFKEAIADATAIKKMAIENAKQSIEESFTPHLTKMLSAKIQEIESEEVTENVEDSEDKEIEGAVGVDKTKQQVTKNLDKEIGGATDLESTNEEINLDELLAELEESEIEEDINLDEAKKDEEKDEDSDEEEKINLEDMSEDQLKSFVEDVIKSMVDAGEIEAGEGNEEENENDEENEKGEGEDEEINLDEVLTELGLNEEDSYKKKVKDFSDGVKNDYVTDQTEEDDAPFTKSKAKNVSFYEDLQEALKTIKTLKANINEVNLLNAKLLYTNKIFKAKNLTESQKLKVLNSFDKAKTVNESKVIYETILESLKEKTKLPSITESMGSASKVIGGPKANPNAPIIEVNETYKRMQKLAGLNN